MRQADPMLRMLKLAQPFWGAMLLAALIGVLTTGSSVGLMAVGAWLISAAALHPSIAALQVAVVAVRFFGIARGVFRYLERLVSHDATFQFLRHVRVWLYARIEPAAPAGLMRRHNGDILSRLIADIETQEGVYMRVAGPVLIAILTAAPMLAFMVTFHPALAFVLVVFYGIGGLVLPVAISRIGWQGRQQGVRTRGALHAALVGSLQGMADLVAYNAAAREAARIEGLSAAYEASQERAAQVDALAHSLEMLIAGAAMLAVTAAAIPRVDGVVLATAALAVIASFEVITPLSTAAWQIGEVRSAAARLFELADMPAVLADSSIPSTIPTCFSLEVRGLTFRYDDGEPTALDNLSFTLPAGGRTALVGPSGAGKSTLVNLLLRFWDYDEGQILIGERDLRSYPAEQVRQWIAVVAQRTHLFNTTIRENLLIARPDSSEEALIEAAKQAQIYDLIQSLPQGFDTWVGEQGAKLSGGERQLIAVARALLKNTPILILDEATANLDPLTEQRVVRALDALMQGRSVLAITHRMNEFQNFERVVIPYRAE